jgi:hypothetical protein
MRFTKVALSEASSALLEPYGIVVSQYLARQSVGVFVRRGRGAPKLEPAERLAPFRRHLR